MLEYLGLLFGCYWIAIRMLLKCCCNTEILSRVACIGLLIDCHWNAIGLLLDCYGNAMINAIEMLLTWGLYWNAVGLLLECYGNAIERTLF